MAEKTIYILLTDTGTWFSKLIKLYTRFPYNHASIALDEGLNDIYSFGRKVYYNPFSGGFVVENLSKGVCKKFPRCACLIYKVSVTEEQYSSLRHQVESFVKDKEKYRYNFFGLLGVLFHKGIKRKNRYFCSQFVSELLIKNNLFFNEKEPELIRTCDLFSIENKEVIYEGSVNDFLTMKRRP